jgi:IS5 family transposase
VIAAALAVGKATLPDYAHPCSPKVFTQPQLLACLTLMVFLRTDYRGVEAFLIDLPGVREWIGLKKTPDHSTLHKAAQRLLGASVSERMLAASVRLMMGRRRIVKRAAADSTGLASGHCSAYFVERRRRGQRGVKNPLFQTMTYTRYPKLTLLTDCSNHLILAVLTGTGPRPDINELEPLLARAPRGLALLSVVADAGFDSEPNHVLAREEHGVRSLMPATHGRPSKRGRPPTGKWRRWMRSLLKTKRRRRRSGYTQRWQVETVMSMIKRNLGEAVSGKGYHSRCRQMRLLAVVHNIMIVLFVGRVFDGAGQESISLHPRERLLTPFLLRPLSFPRPWIISAASRQRLLAARGESRFKAVDNSCFLACS